MTIRLLTYDGAKSSAVKLGFPVDKELPGYAEDYRRDVIVRWGNSKPAESRDGATREYPHVINPRKAICLNCEKQRSVDALSRIVRTPILYGERVPTGRAAVVRPYEHIAGDGFNIVQGPYDVPYGFYATELIKTDLEVRVWFCGGHTLVAKRAKRTDQSDHPCRSEWGYEFNYNGVTGVRHRFDPELGPDTLLAAAKIGLDSGAADVLCRGDDRFFLELNSAPAIDHWRISEFYQTYLPLLAAKKLNER